MKRKFILDILVTGFALFAMFFGAGNLIFPPYLGWSSGDKWFVSFLCFIVIDVGLSMLALITVAKVGKGAVGITEKLGSKLSTLVLTLNVICLGPLIAIPRTAATTFEFGVNPIFASISPLVSSIVFFTGVVILSIKQTKVIDIVGGVMAPIMYVAIIWVIAAGIINPLGIIEKQTAVLYAVNEGIVSGYQTMDVMATLVFSSTVLISIRSKGYKTMKEQFKIISYSGIICTIALCTVYGGLAYLGASASSKFTTVMSQSELLLGITNTLLGRNGIILLGVIVTVACLTTAIGLVSSSASYFAQLSTSKMKYEHIVIIISVFSCILSNLGLSSIIALAAPILDVIYPLLIVLILLSLFSKRIHNKSVFTTIAFGTFIINLIYVIMK